jgi:hypothetical protein
VRIGDGWKWLRIVSNGGFGISGDEPLCSTTRELVN